MLPFFDERWVWCQQLTWLFFMQLVKFGENTLQVLQRHKHKHTHFLHPSLSPSIHPSIHPNQTQPTPLLLQHTYNPYRPLFLHQCLFFFYLPACPYTIFLSTSCHYLHRHLFPAMDLCAFIIHGVVLMAQAAMSNVNLCASKARSAWTPSVGRVAAPRAPGAPGLVVQGWASPLDHTWIYLLPKHNDCLYCHTHFFFQGDLGFM